MKSAEKIVPLPPAPPRRHRAEIDFLPAALEIVERPPSPAGRAIAAIIIAVFCLALAWAAFGKVDIVATASGKIIPSGRSRIVQPFETGVVRAIHVHDGQQVKAGDLLIELDPTISEADVRHLKNDLVAAELDVARLRAALANPDNPLAAFKPPPAADPKSVATQRKFLLEQVAEQRAKVAELDRELAQKQAERAAISANIAKIKATLPMLQQIFDVRKVLLEQKLGSKLQYLDASLKLVEQQREVAVQQSHYRQADAAVATLAETRAKTVAEFRRTLLSDLATAERKSADAEQDVIKAEKRSKLQFLRAPVAGVVQQLAVHTVGGVVTPAQPLLVLVPVGEKLRVEAMIANRDIGFVDVGQKAEIKVDTFNFTRYGLLHGKVLSLSRDAIVQDKTAQKAGGGTLDVQNASDTQNERNLAYAALVSLDRSHMQIGSKRVNLLPGMAVVVEIRTGSRTILSYLLSPLAKLGDEALRER